MRFSTESNVDRYYNDIKAYTETRRRREKDATPLKRQNSTLTGSWGAWYRRTEVLSSERWNVESDIRSGMADCDDINTEYGDTEPVSIGICSGNSLVWSLGLMSLDINRDLDDINQMWYQEEHQSHAAVRIGYRVKRVLLTQQMTVIHTDATKMGSRGYQRSTGIQPIRWWDKTWWYQTDIRSNMSTNCRRAVISGDILQYNTATKS